MVARARGRSLSDRPVVLLAIGTQFPDLVDKPLAYTVSVLPGGRALAHSLLVFVPLAVGLWVVFERSRHLTGPFLFGYGTHLLGDAWWELVALRVGRLTWLVWPVLEPPAYEATSFRDHYRKLTEMATGGTVIDVIAAQPRFFAGIALTLGVMALWVADGTPGLRWFRRGLRR